MSIHGKRYAISDGDRAGDPFLIPTHKNVGFFGRSAPLCIQQSHCNTLAEVGYLLSVHLNDLKAGGVVGVVGVVISVVGVYHKYSRIDK